MNKTFKKIMFQSVIVLVLIFCYRSLHIRHLSGNWRECLNTLVVLVKLLLPICQLYH